MPEAVASGGLTRHALTPATWPSYESLVAAHGGVFGGCWCMGFHTRDLSGGYEANRARKHAMVQEGTTRAALVHDGDRCVGWAQWGRPEELPQIKNRRAYDAGRSEDAVTADWRITCFFVDRAYRRKGVAGEALQGALEQIAAAGGGLVEAYPEAIEGQRTSASFLFGGTLGLFEKAGFTPVRKIGLHRWVVRRNIEGERPT